VYIGGKVLYATQTGYVCDYAKMKKTNGLLNWTTEVSLANARQGDISSGILVLQIVRIVILPS
jgi:hypothetical protein